MATIRELLKTVTGNLNDESVKNIDPYRLIKSFPHVPWQDLKGFKDITDHNYFILNPNILWRSLTFRLTALQNAINMIRDTYPDIAHEMDLTKEKINTSSYS